MRNFFSPSFLRYPKGYASYGVPAGGIFAVRPRNASSAFFVTMRRRGVMRIDGSFPDARSSYVAFRPMRKIRCTSRGVRTSPRSARHHAGLTMCVVTSKRKPRANILEVLHALLCGRKSCVVVYEDYPTRATGVSIAHCRARVAQDVRRCHADGGPPFRPPPVQATALAHPAPKATANAAPRCSGLARGSRRALFRRPGGGPSVGPQEDRMISVYGTTFAQVSEIARGIVVRRLAAFPSTR